MSASYIDVILKTETPWTNKHGNQVYSGFIGEHDRLEFDFGPCSSENGWKQFDTDQDAWYFGVWVNIEKRMTVTYAEGDLTVITCANLESFRAELEDMEKAEFYDERPKV